MDEPVGLERVRCRALTDMVEGWVTLCGNQGTGFLEHVSKPYYCCAVATDFQTNFESSSSILADIQVGEIFEVLEGPRREAPLETLRVRGRAAKDGAIGYVTLKDSQGNPCLEAIKVLVCKQSIAVTTTFDISDTNGKPIRKLDVGETLEIVEGPMEDSKRSLVRCKAKTKKDNQEGWVTIKGNQGTVYAEESDKHYVCLQSVTLESRHSTGSTALRVMEKGEIFEARDNPKPETKDGENRVKGRNLTTGSVGWFTLTGANMSPWCPSYKCIQETPIHSSFDQASSSPVRNLEVGEGLEALDVPVMEGGVLRVHARAEQDGTIGFVMLKGDQGTLNLQPVFGKQ